MQVGSSFALVAFVACRFSIFAFSSISLLFCPRRISAYLPLRFLSLTSLALDIVARNARGRHQLSVPIVSSHILLSS